MDGSFDAAPETSADRWRRRARKAAMHVIVALTVYGLIVLSARALHRRVLYQPPPAEPAGDSVAAAPPPPEGATLLTARAADGAAVNALEFAPASAPASATKAARGRTIVHFHGNAETADDNAALARILARHGFSVVLVEYRGYGRSRASGSPSETGLYADASAVLDAVAARGVSAGDVVLWGQSLGSGVAVEMARRSRGARLILVAPFTSTAELAQRVAPILPASFVMVDRFDNVAKAPSIQTPTLVVHGDIDDVIPIEFGERVSRALPHGTFLRVTEGRHDNLYKNSSVIAAAVAHAGS
jgi:pimeloyl-ACP methyl ester carboxylesterase